MPWAWGAKMGLEHVFAPEPLLWDLQLWVSDAEDVPVCLFGNSRPSDFVFGFETETLRGNLQKPKKKPG